MAIELTIAEDALCAALASKYTLNLKPFLSLFGDNASKHKASSSVINQVYMWFNQASILVEYFQSNSKIFSSDIPNSDSIIITKILKEAAELGKKSLIQSVGLIVGKDRRDISWPAVILANQVSEGFDLAWDQRLVAGFSFSGLPPLTIRASAVLLLVRHLASTPGLRLDPKGIIDLFGHLVPPGLRWSPIDTFEKTLSLNICEARIQSIPGLNTPRITRIGIALEGSNGLIEWIPPTIALPDLGDWKTLSRSQSTASEFRCFPGWSSFDRMVALQMARECWQASTDSNHASENTVLARQSDSLIPQNIAPPPDSKVLKGLQKSPLAENSSFSQPTSGTNSTKPLRELISSIDGSKAWFFLGYDDSIVAIENGTLPNADPNTFGSAAQILLNRILLLGRWEILSPKESEILESMVSRIRYQGINLKVCLTPDEINLASDYQFLPADIAISDIQSYHPKAQAGLPYLHEVGLVIGTVAPSSSNIRLSAGLPSQSFADLHTQLRQSGLYGSPAINILNNWPQAKRSLQDRDYQAVRLTKAIFSNDSWRDRNTYNFEATSKALDQFLNHECSIRLEFPKTIRIDPQNIQEFKVINRLTARNYNVIKVRIPGLLGPKGPISPAEVEVD